ncbi:MAG: transporter, family, tartrate transporter [Rhodospirillales bacterium]|nr:transporter, family, tartrate transporter [Rhodospirillales bacterium]
MRASAPGSHSVLATLTNPIVLQLGVLGALGIGSFYALSLSAPTLLMAATGWDVTHVGRLTGSGGLIAAVGMLYTGALSDRLGSRWGVFIGALLVMASGSLTLAFATSGMVTVIGYLLFALGWSSVTNATLMVWADVLSPRIRALGCATANSMNFVGGFVAPISWGIAKDATGNYKLGLTVMTFALLVEVAMVLILRAQVTAQRRILATTSSA